MSARGIRGIIIASVAATCLSQCAPPAHALPPPTVDSTRLPAPARPAPPRQTTQLAACVTPTTPQDAPDTDPLRTLRLQSVWPLTRGEGQRVAVIDTGVFRHSRLPLVEAGGDYVSSGDGTQDCDGHGTIVAGIIAAAPDGSNPAGFAGIAPAATILAIRQSSTRFGPIDDPSADGFGDVDTMAMAVRTAADLGATVINISSVACAPESINDTALGAALAYAVDIKDVVVVAAAGNVGGTGQCPQQGDSDEISWETATVAVSPAWYDDYVLTVGSVDAQGAPSPFTMAGPWLDIAAPGEGMVSLKPGGDGVVDTMAVFGQDVPISGTSYAAPVVSGVAALVRARFPELTARQVMQRLEATAHRPPGGWNPVVGNGTVDALAAVGSDAPPTSAPEPIGVQLPTPALTSAPIADDRAVNTAITGAAGCAVVLTVASAALGRLRRLRSDAAGQHISGD